MNDTIRINKAQLLMLKLLKEVEKFDTEMELLGYSDFLDENKWQEVDQILVSMSEDLDTGEMGVGIINQTPADIGIKASIEDALKG